MKKRRKILGIMFLGICVITAFGIFVTVSSANSSEKTQVRLAHCQAKDSEIADTIALLSDLVAEDKESNLEVDIYPSGVLGTEKEMVEMVQAGVLDMAKVSSNTLGQFEDKYSIFALPYLFTDQQHYYDAMANSEAIEDLFTCTEEAGFIAIGYYANGSRNFYLKENVEVSDPSVLKGLKIRSMQSSTSMEMIELMGGNPVAMASSETYTALQQGVVDGAENTELALTVDKHGELVGSYTYTEHQYSPDIYIISTKKWNSLTTKQQECLKKALVETNENFVTLYHQMMEDAIEEAEGMGVTVYKDIDKSAFIEAVQPMHERFEGKGDDYQSLYDDIQAYSTYKGEE